MDESVIEEHLRFLRRLGTRNDTMRHRRDCIRRLARSLEVPLLEATDRDLDRWQATIADPNRRPEPLTPSAVATYTSHTRAFYKWAHHVGKIDVNPALDLLLPKIKKRVPHPIPENDLKLALRCADEQVTIWLTLAGWCGLRGGEISRLTGDSVIDEPDGMLLRVDGKGGKERIVPVPKVMVTMVRSWVKRGPLFRTVTGLPVNPDYVSRTVSVFFSGIGLPYTLHWCRHRFGTQHYKLFRDIRATQELMGHASPATTAMYVQLSQERAKRSMDRLGKTLPVTEKRPAAVDGQTAPRSRRRSA